MAPGPLPLIGACLAIFAGALVHGTLGFGMALVAVPVLAFVMPERLPQVMLVLAMPAILWLVWFEREHVRMRSVRWVLLGRLLGVVPGALLVAALPTRSLQVLFGVATLVAVGLISLPGFVASITHASQVAAGTVSGVMATAASMGGPPIALLYSRQTGAELRATLASVFLIGNTMSIAALALSGRFTAADGLVAAILVGPMMLGLWGSRRLVTFVDRGRARAAVLVLVAVAGVALIVQAAGSS